MPIYQDTNSSITSTPSDLIYNLRENETKPKSNECVLLDHNAFGSGCACLQVTFQASNVKEALYLHDQLATIAPLMLALTAACPIFKGYLCDTDCRWYVASYTFDDRTAEERQFNVKFDWEWNEFFVFINSFI